MVLTRSLIALYAVFFYLIAFAQAQDDKTPWTDAKKFRDAVLKVHNDARKKFDAEPLKWNETLAKGSKVWSSKCQWKHSGGENGENLATNYETPAAAVQAWVNESKEYDFSDPGFSKSTGHFTQVVWKNTTSVGCSYKDCGDRHGNIREGKGAKGMFLVCWYNPGGNVLGTFKTMVGGSSAGKVDSGILWASMLGLASMVAVAL